MASGGEDMILKGMGTGTEAGERSGGKLFIEKVPKRAGSSRCKEKKTK